MEPNKKGKAWMGTFQAKTERDLVLKQIKHNSEYWGSDRCKKSTLVKYCRAKGVGDPEMILSDLIRKGLVMTHGRAYVGLVPGFELIEYGRMQMIIAVYDSGWPEKGKFPTKEDLEIADELGERLGIPTGCLTDDQVKKRAKDLDKASRDYLDAQAEKLKGGS